MTGELALVSLSGHSGPRHVLHLMSQPLLFPEKNDELGASCVYFVKVHYRRKQEKLENRLL